LDLSENNSGGSAIIVGYDPSGAAFMRTVNFPSATIVHLTLDWLNLGKVDIKWREKPDGGGEGKAIGSITNILFNKKP
jgi:hypothetical protein